MAGIINAPTGGPGGIVIQGDGTGIWQLQSNNVTVATVSPGALTMSGTLSTAGGLITSGNALTYTSATNGGTTLDFTGIPSWVKRVTVMFNGVSTSGTSNILIQFGTSGGIDNSGYLGSVSTTGNASAGAAANFSAGFTLFASAAATSHGSYIFSLMGSNLWAGFGLFGRSDTTNTTQTAGSKSLSGTLTTVRITTANGTDTFDAGSVNILYEG
jgi:hypothetical protein